MNLFLFYCVWNGQQNIEAFISIRTIDHFQQVLTEIFS